MSLNNYKTLVKEQEANKKSSMAISRLIQANNSTSQSFVYNHDQSIASMPDMQDDKKLNIQEEGHKLKNQSFSRMINSQLYSGGRISTVVSQDKIGKRSILTDNMQLGGDQSTEKLQNMLFLKNNDKMYPKKNFFAKNSLKQTATIDHLAIPKKQFETMDNTDQ